MKYVRDTTGRFDQRPHYEMSELDEACEHIITSFMQEQHGHLILPVPTDDLTKLIERDADDLDLYADLSVEGPDVEGITYFRPGQKPTVRIAHGLSEKGRPENRLRTTLSHEYGHVKFHDPLWQRVKTPALSLFRRDDFDFRPKMPASQNCQCSSKRLDGVAGWLYLRCSFNACWATTQARASVSRAE